VAAAPSQPDLSFSLLGKLLLADPSLRGGSFHRSVILLAEHHPTRGAYGLVLNHPTGKTVGDFLTGADFAALRELPVHEGGPVEADQLTFSSFWWSPKLGFRSAIRLSAEDAARHSGRPGRIVHAFLGYSGWTGGQLEAEVRRSSWFFTPPPPTVISHPHDITLWTQLMRHLSPLHRILAEAPDDPTLN
jgi:putative transcriptional regulator